MPHKAKRLGVTPPRLQPGSSGAVQYYLASKDPKGFSHLYCSPPCPGDGGKTEWNFAEQMYNRSRKDVLFVNKLIFMGSFNYLYEIIKIT